MFGDVVASNVVGYQALGTKAIGRKCICPTFSDVGGQKRKIMLSEIKVVGYQDSEWWQDNEDGPQVRLIKLADNGAYETTYVWNDVFDDEWEGGYWKIQGGAKITPANDVEIEAGHGYFVEAPNFRDAASISLSVAGEVITGSQAIGLRSIGRLVAGNMMPTATKLTKVEVQGYQDSEWWQDNEDGPQVRLIKLADTGAYETTYVWNDVFDDEWEGGYWKIQGGAKVTPASDVDVAAGEGWFVECPNFRDAQSINLVIPACIENPAEK